MVGRMGFKAGIGPETTVDVGKVPVDACFVRTWKRVLFKAAPPALRRLKYPVLVGRMENRGNRYQDGTGALRWVDIKNPYLQPITVEPEGFSILADIPLHNGKERAKSLTTNGDAEKGDEK